MAQLALGGWTRRLRSRGWLRRQLRGDDPRLSTLLAHVVALAAALLMLALTEGPPDMGAPLAIAVGLSFLRTFAAGQQLVRSTLALDAVGTAVLLAGTGAPGSPLYPLALAGTWWAAHVPGRRSATIYGVILVAAYAVLVLPPALRVDRGAGAIQELTVLVVVAVVCARLVRTERWGRELNEALTIPPFGAEQLAIRDGLVRALRTMDIPVDVVIAAGQVGLTAVQAELLAYLMLGLTNYEISDAVGLSESAVRYRLTHLYRTLGVKGRKEAAAHAHALGISPPTDAGSGAFPLGRG